MPFSSPGANLQLGIFRLQDVCVRIQDGMEDFVETAALEKVPHIEAVFRWLRKRGISIALISDADRSNTETVLQRLSWGVGEEEMLQMVLTNQRKRENSVADVIELAGLPNGRLVFSVFDLPYLLRAAHSNQVQLNLGVTNGRCSYAELSTVPNHRLLDGPIQLPNYLLEQNPGIADLPFEGIKRGSGHGLDKNGWRSSVFFW